MRKLENSVLSDAYRMVVDGFDVRVAAEDTEQQGLAEHVADALRLLATVDARRYARARSDLRYIFVSVLPGPAYWIATRTCSLPVDMVRENRKEVLACAIVHEAVHARLGWRRGRSADPILAVETCCVREQIAVAKRLPLADYPEREAYVAFLRQKTRTPWWKRETMARQWRQTFADADTPKWIQWIFTSRVTPKSPAASNRSPQQKAE